MQRRRNWEAHGREQRQKLAGICIFQVVSRGNPGPEAGNSTYTYTNIAIRAMVCNCGERKEKAKLPSLFFL